MASLTATLRILEPYSGLYAYYDGRIEGVRLWSAEPNWLDDGAYSLGIASYAIVSDAEAIVYDTHMSLDHARAIRAHLEGLGIRRMRVVLSHWHTDHIAGNEAFSDCEIIANRLTRDAMAANREKLATGSPPIAPLAMPTTVFEDELDITVGNIPLRLRRFDIHSADGTVMLIPSLGVLLAGDTVEDTVTYISEPENTARHIEELDRLAALDFRRILPNHGAEAVIASGGYAPSLIDATGAYLGRLLARLDDPVLDAEPLSAFVAPETEKGWIFYFPPYEDVHRGNIAALRKARG
ncbi:MBL fold metallo-hydrolase [Pseudomonas sp. R2.Fl]|nr:MBL fold metallo-hydrolase [Pseudomonas sp. R2.Fl]